jgi:hypothetical protein
MQKLVEILKNVSPFFTWRNMFVGVRFNKDVIVFCFFMFGLVVNLDEEKKISYRDVDVEVDGKHYFVWKDYAKQIVCTKAGGWQLYNVLDGKNTLIGGEFDSSKFNIRVKNRIVCGKKEPF